KAVLMANLSSCDLDVLSESIENSDLNAQLQEKVFAIAALKKELRKLKGINVLDTAVSKPSATTAPGIFKLDIEPISHRLKNNRDAHEVVQIVLWYLDSGCSKHMTGDRSQLINFVQKFLGTVKFRNDHVAKIMGYGDYQIGNVTISRVYYVEGPGHNLFSVGQFCDSDLEVAFHQYTCFILNLEGVDLLTGSRGNNLYTMSLQDMMASSPICLLSKASKTKSWLWHRHLSHLNIGVINHLARQGLVRAMTSTPFGEFLTGGRNVSSSMGSQLTGNLLSMYTQRRGSSLSPNSRLWNGTTISIWIRYRQPFKKEESQFNKFKEDKLRVLLALETKELLQPQGETMQLIKQRL
nr:integrase, catalytic region, zinc finger, CCHC-type, peptidase aspartic, catalytic [Tanacetum cinerariifolium]